ncbi:unnamed protein product [Cladocopium goreaui]|uniref:Uncharacterized protein n=1 Tax=Cladocopium goreaui TaxID=2562237 RepID=A0A9P1BK73_9DINO|nr:unnamed protein product [Cladocopium goreaui]
MAAKGRWSQGYSKQDDWEWQAWDKASWEPGYSSWPVSREWSVRLLPSERRTPPGLNGKGDGHQKVKGGKGKSKGKEREEVYDWKADRQADWQGTSKGSSKGKGKDGYGSYGKGKESGSTGYGFDSGKVKGDGKGKGRKGKERSKETGWATETPVAPLGPIGSAHPSEPVMRQGQGPSDRQAMPVGARPQDYPKKPPLRARPKAAAESKRTGKVGERLRE